MQKQKVIPAAGNRSIITVAKVASMHDIKMVLPATIYIGAEKNLFIYTDSITGYVKAYEEQFLETQVFSRFITDHMPGIESVMKRAQKNNSIPPLYILKMLPGDVKDSVYAPASCQLYFDKYTFINDINFYWGKCELIA